MNEHSGTAKKKSAIETFGLSKQCGGYSALENLNLDVPAHPTFGFLGPNGAGKTTTMKLLLGLIKPSTGRSAGSYRPF